MDIDSITMGACFLLTCNFEIFSIVNSIMASKKATKMENPIHQLYFAVIQVNHQTVTIIRFRHPVRVHHAIEMFQFKNVLDIYTQKTTKTNSCLVLPASSQWQQMHLTRRLRRLPRLYHAHLWCVTGCSSRMPL